MRARRLAARVHQLVGGGQSPAAFARPIVLIVLIAHLGDLGDADLGDADMRGANMRNTGKSCIAFQGRTSAV